MTTVSGGTLSIGNGGSGASIGGTSGVVLANGANITFNHADPVSFAAPISGSGSLLKTGNGTLSLTNFNTYTGATIVSGGRLQLGPAQGPTGILANSVLHIDPSGLTPGSYSTINNLGTGGSNFTDSSRRRDRGKRDQRSECLPVHGRRRLDIRHGLRQLGQNR